MDAKVIDTSAFLHATLDFGKAKYLTPNSVIQEVLEDTAKAVMDAAIHSGRLQVADPAEKSLARVKDAAAATGDIAGLSRTDLDVIALALEKNAAIVSDDYAIQNTARFLGVRTEPAVQEGIRRDMKWVRECEGCNRRYDALKAGPCPVCGSRLKKKAI